MIKAFKNSWRHAEILTHILTHINSKFHLNWVKLCCPSQTEGPSPIFLKVPSSGSRSKTTRESLSSWRWHIPWGGESWKICVIQNIFGMDPGVFGVFDTDSDEWISISHGCCMFHNLQSFVLVDHFESWYYHTIWGSKAWYPDAKVSRKWDNGMPLSRLHNSNQCLNFDDFDDVDDFDDLNLREYLLSNYCTSFWAMTMMDFGLP